jgi:hypothetical protein
MIGMGSSEDGIVGWFLRVVVLLSFVVGPALLLLGFEFRFVPYHSFLVTTVQRVAVVLDAMLTLLVWQKIVLPSRGLDGETHDRSTQRLFVTLNRGAFAIICSGVVAMSFLVTQISPRGLVMENERLVEPDEEKLSRLAVTLSLRGRDLRYGDFRGAVLRKADLSGATLADADLRDARLDDAYLRFADLSRAELYGASLRGADLSGATLDGVRDLIQAQLGQACGTDVKLPPDLTLEPCPSQ